MLRSYAIKEKRVRLRYNYLHVVFVGFCMCEQSYKFPLKWCKVVAMFLFITLSMILAFLSKVSV